MKFQGKKQVAFGCSKLRVNKRGGLQNQGIPVNGATQLAGKMFFKEGPRVVCIRESRLQQLVVWMMNGFLGHGLSKKVAYGGSKCRLDPADLPTFSLGTNRRAKTR